MNCNQCRTDNPADNKFCRECGLPLAPVVLPTREELMRKQAQVAELLADALRLREKNLPKEAMSLAEEASRLMPDSTRALALLTSLYEQERQWDKAIAAMERVVALTPDSIADREKLALLRQKAQMPIPAAAPAPAKSTEKGPMISGYVPLVLAGGVAAIVFFATLPLAMKPRRATLPTPQAVAQLPVNASPAAPFFDPVTPLREAAPLPSDNTADPFERQRPIITPAPSVSARNESLALPNVMPPQSVRSVRRATPIPFTPILPMPVSPPRQGGDSLPPLGAGDAQTGFGGGERIAVRPPSGNDAGSGGNTPAVPAPRTDTGDNGYIYIKVHPAPASKPDDSSDNGKDSGNAQSLNAAPTGTPSGKDIERAQFLQGSGHYAEAIRVYQEAIGSGARGEAYQGIAMAYQRVGDAEAARTSYQDAIRVYEKDKKVRPRLSEQGIAACEAALTVLGGN